MDVLTIVLTAIETLVKFEPTIVQAGADLKPYAAALYQQLTGQAITDDQRASLEAGVDALFARLEVPLPPAQPGDPDYVPPATPTPPTS